MPAWGTGIFVFIIHIIWPSWARQCPVEKFGTVLIVVFQEMYFLVVNTHQGKCDTVSEAPWKGGRIRHGFCTLSPLQDSHAPSLLVHPCLPPTALIPWCPVNHNNNKYRRRRPFSHRLVWRSYEHFHTLVASVWGFPSFAPCAWRHKRYKSYIPLTHIQCQLICNYILTTNWWNYRRLWDWSTQYLLPVFHF